MVSGQPHSETSDTLAPRPVSPAYGRYAVAILMLTYALSFLDRQVVTILAEPIKNDLKLADWQLGMMTGMAFALLYTVLGIPIARLAERGHRPFIIATAVMTWSAFTVLCGQTHNFIQLLLARAGVGVGEAGGTPPALSLIADYAPKEKRASSVAFYMIGAPLGGLAGMAIGGLVADHWGWRHTFLLIGLPGILVATVIALTLREPRSKAMRKLAQEADREGVLMKDLAALGKKPAYRWVVTAATARGFETYGASAFYGSFFLRNHMEALQQISAPLGLKPLGFLGVTLGLTLGIAGVVGVTIGGFLTDYGARK
ncbi:MAG: transporter, partial [Caulobacteraceae bacterium]|nr:transporter [Caulobacteraceae bacterium]